MNAPFDIIFSKKPVLLKRGVSYFGSEKEGDQFDETSCVNEGSERTRRSTEGKPTN